MTSRTTLLLFGAALLITRPVMPLGNAKEVSLAVKTIHVTRLPGVTAEFQVATCENLIRQLEKDGFSHVYRDGHGNAMAVASLIVLRSTVQGFKEDSERVRQVTTVSGATFDQSSLQVHQPGRYVPSGAGHYLQGPVLWQETQSYL